MEPGSVRAGQFMHIAARTPIFSVPEASEFTLRVEKRQYAYDFKGVLKMDTK